jgi:shikimate kinase
MRIFLIGYMGSGKTTVGRKIASLIDAPFIDLDTRIESSSGKSITELFSTGEDDFRKLERQSLMEISKEPNLVVSTGGGTPCFFDNMEWMNQQGITVYLKLDPISLFHRLRASKRPRPLIAGMEDDELLAYIEKNLTERESFYKKSKYQVKGESIDALSLVNNIRFGESQLR